MGYVIIDNYLHPTEFQEIQNIFFNSMKVPWYFHNYTSDESDTSNINYQFVHSLVKHGEQIHSGNMYIKPILQKIHPLILDRVKINLLPISESNIKNSFHIDASHFVNSDIKYSIGIFYLNTNNGVTELEDGTIIESVANRMVFMSGDTLHRGTFATDSRRVLINFNFINEDTVNLYKNI